MGEDQGVALEVSESFFEAGCGKLDCWIVIRRRQANSLLHSLQPASRHLDSQGSFKSLQLRSQKQKQEKMEMAQSGMDAGLETLLSLPSERRERYSPAIVSKIYSFLHLLDFCEEFGVSLTNDPICPCIQSYKLIIFSLKRSNSFK